MRRPVVWAPSVSFIHNWYERNQISYHISVSSPDHEDVWLWVKTIFLITTIVMPCNQDSSSTGYVVNEHLRVGGSYVASTISNLVDAPCRHWTRAQQIQTVARTPHDMANITLDVIHVLPCYGF